MAESKISKYINIKKIKKTISSFPSIPIGERGYKTVEFDENDITDSSQVISIRFETGNISNMNGLQITFLGYDPSTRKLWYLYYAPSTTAVSSVDFIIYYIA